jgi:cytochrome P450
VIKEGLRIWPPAVGLIPKLVPPEGDVINGMFVPGGTEIGYGAFSIFRNKKIWGEDADLFRPERWLEGDKIKEQESCLEIIFNVGRSQCLGKNVALMELNKVFVEVSLYSNESRAASQFTNGGIPVVTTAFRIQLG